MRFLFFLFLLMSISFAIANPIKVSVDRNPAYLNESFDITFTANKDPDENPNFKPLSDRFEILNKNHSSKMSWIKGQASTQIQWTFTVMAKYSGEQTIPALSFGSEISPELKITINKKRADISDDTPENNAALFLEVEASPLNPYLQSQVIYTLRFFRRVNIAEASLKDLEHNDAVIEKLGEDKNYKVQKNGVPYVVMERKYAVFPQKSGILTIEPIELTAAVLANNSRSGGFFGSHNTRRERIKSNPIHLTVQPIPADFKGQHWLPAKEVRLIEKWSGDTQKMPVGEPLTRTLTLMVKGATLGKLPELQATSQNKNLKNYPDQPVLKEKKTKEGVIAFREEKIAFIPSKAGSYTLPEITLDWFNVATGQTETIKIAETTVIAVGGVSGTIDDAQTTDATTQTLVESNDVGNNNKLWQIISACLALGWLLTLVFVFKKNKQTVTKKLPEAEISLKSCLKALKKACDNNDAKAVKEVLLTWGRLQYNSITLAGLATHCNDDLADEILNLNKNLYSQQRADWKGEGLFQAFSKQKSSHKQSKKLTSDGLEPLYRI